MRQKHEGTEWRQSTVVDKQHLFFKGDDRSLCGKGSLDYSVAALTTPKRCSSCVGIDVALRGAGEREPWRKTPLVRRLSGVGPVRR